MYPTVDSGLTITKTVQYVSAVFIEFRHAANNALIHHLATSVISIIIIAIEIIIETRSLITVSHLHANKPGLDNGFEKT